MGGKRRLIDAEAQWLALYGDELEDGDPLKPK